MLELYLQCNSVDDYVIGVAFDGGCAYNLDNAKLLYAKHKEACDKYIDHRCFFVADLLTMGKVDTLLWLNSLNNDKVISQVDLIFKALIEKRLTDSNEYKFLCEHFFTPFLI